MMSFHAKVVHFTFYIVMVFQNFDVDLKKQKKTKTKTKKINNIFMEAIASQNIVFYFPL